MYIGSNPQHKLKAGQASGLFRIAQPAVAYRRGDRTEPFCMGRFTGVAIERFSESVGDPPSRRALRRHVISR
ncbi:hypothetical protein C8Z91_02920 [Paenibacillus elgii]|uniref:Uncharacterized protein n=1 Tax=Paenibacillus elgii TaxID=189691 RepID=A0A2T6G9H6_9BACL|nr:hypothetical protein C8Z91_02920 [Paenibacillus elgii]